MSFCRTTAARHQLPLDGKIQDTQLLTVFKHWLELTSRAKRNSPSFLFMQIPICRTDRLSEILCGPSPRPNFPPSAARQPTGRLHGFCRQTLLLLVLKCIWTVFSCLYAVSTLYLHCCCSTGFTNNKCYYKLQRKVLTSLYQIPVPQTLDSTVCTVVSDLIELVQYSVVPLGYSNTVFANTFITNTNAEMCSAVQRSRVV